jgi:hypothetical protein
MLQSAGEQGRQLLLPLSLPSLLSLSLIQPHLFCFQPGVRLRDQLGDAFPLLRRAAALLAAGPTDEALDSVRQAHVFLINHVLPHEHAEDTQLYQIVHVERERLRYEARTATGDLYDAFELRRDRDGNRLIETGPRTPERRRAPASR